MSFSYNLFLLTNSVLAFEDNRSNTNIYNNNVLNTTLIDGLVEKCRELNDEADYLGALNISDTILSVDKNNTDAMISKGDVLDELEKPEEALVWYDKALALDGNNTDAMISKGDVLDELEKPEEALVWYDKALVLDGNNTDAMISKGDVLDGSKSRRRLWCGMIKP